MTLYETLSDLAISVIVFFTVQVWYEVLYNLYKKHVHPDLPHIDELQISVRFAIFFTIVAVVLIFIWYELVHKRRFG